MTQQQTTVLISGVSSGIGLAIAKDFLKQGFKVFGSVRKLDDAQELVDMSNMFVPLVFDVTDVESIEAGAVELKSHLNGGGLNVLVNNAGVGLSGPICLMPTEHIKHGFEVNVFGMLNLTRAVLPLLGAVENAGHEPGRIINIGSVSGSVTVPFVGAYSATKHAVEALAQAFRRELKPFGIEVSTIQPGMIRTELASNDLSTSQGNAYEDSVYKEYWLKANTSMNELMQKAKSPDVVVQAVNKALRSKKPKPRYPLDPSWYMGRFLPDRVFDNIIFGALKIKDMMKVKKTS